MCEESVDGLGPQHAADIAPDGGNVAECGHHAWNVVDHVVSERGPFPVVAALALLMKIKACRSHAGLPGPIDRVVATLEIASLWGCVFDGNRLEIMNGKRPFEIPESQLDVSKMAIGERRPLLPALPGDVPVGRRYPGAVDFRFARFQQPLTVRDIDDGSR